MNAIEIESRKQAALIETHTADELLDLASARVTAAREALTATILGRLWYRKRWRWLELFLAPSLVHEYHAAMSASFHEMARGVPGHW